MLAATLVGVTLLIGRALLSVVAVGEIKAWWILRLAKRVERASRTLEHGRREEMLDEWIAELETLGDRPVTAAKFVRGLPVAVRALSPPEPSIATVRRPRGRRQTSASRWRHPWRTWPVGVAIAGVVSPAATQQVLSACLLATGMILVTRVAAHRSLGYGSCPASPLARATRVETYTAVACLATAIGAVAHPLPAVLFALTLLLYVLVVTTSARTMTLAAQAGLPSAAQAFRWSPAMRDLRAVAVGSPRLPGAHLLRRL